MSLPAWATRILGRVRTTRVFRAWERYGRARGDLLAAGIAYFAFFSLFPALALAAVVFGFLLRGRPDLLAAVGDALNAALPGYVRTPGNPGGLLELAAPETATLSVTGAVALVTLLLGGLGWIGSMRDGIRAVMGVAGAPGNAVSAKVRDLGVLTLLGVAVLVAAVLTSTVGGAASWAAERVGLGESGWIVALVGTLVSLVIDTAVMVALLRVLSGVPLPWRDVRRSAFIGGVLLTLVKLVGAQLVARATANPLFGSIVVVVGLLFWLNLLARVVLLTAAWAANDLTEAGKQVGMPSAAPSAGPAAPVAGSVSAAARPGAAAGLPDFAAGSTVVGVRDRDRVGLAAGAVLGAAAALAARGLARALGLLRPRRQRS